MKYTWRSAPPVWALADAAAHYADMAAKGWLLQKRGTHFDRYCRAEPQTLQFWLELVPATDEIPPEKLALYEECGWTLMVQDARTYVFSAPATSEIPQPYDVGDPQQEQMIRHVHRSYRRGIIVMCFLLALYVVCIAFWGNVPLHETLAAWWLEAYWVLWLTYAVWEDAYGLAALNRLRKALRRGEWPKPKRRTGFRVVKRLLTIPALLCLLIAAVQEIHNWNPETTLLPQSDGNYIVATQLDLERDEDDSNWGKRIGYNTLKTRDAFPFYTKYHTCEPLRDGAEDWVLFQDTYVLTSETLALPIAEGLLEDSTFADAELYVPVEIAGLDAAWYVPGGMEYIAVADNRVVYGTLTGNDGSELLLRCLEATAALWNAG